MRSDYKEYDKKYRIEHKNEIKKRQKEYYQKNKERIKLHVIEYLNKNKDILKEKSKEYYQKNKEHKLKKCRERYYNTDRRTRWCDQTISGHRSKGYIVNISKKGLFELSLKAETCPYCGIKLEWINPKRIGFNHDSPTLDRIYNQTVMELNNVEIICHRCNLAKGRFTRNEFIEFCKTVSERSKTI